MQETLGRSYEVMTLAIMKFDPKKTEIISKNFHSSIGSIIEYKGKCPHFEILPITPYHVGGCI